jgi:hypothetical protein
MSKIINEGLDYHDMVGQIEPVVSVDEYKAKMGKDSEVVTLSFILNSKSAAQDLVQWLEVGYDWVMDASVSTGEYKPGQWLVFAEMKRRSSVPKRICELLEDLYTLTDRKADQYKIKVDDKEYVADPEILNDVIITSPLLYKEKIKQEKELNEYRTMANLKAVSLYEEDTYIKDLKAIARI